MSEEKETYEGKEIFLEEDEQEPKLVIESRDVGVIHEEGGYYTNHLPYENYSSLRELAEDLVDHWAEVEPELGRVEEKESESKGERDEQ